MSVNKVILVGNLGADPEKRGPATRLRLATSEKRKQGEEWVDHTEWHNVTCFGSTADNVMKFCKKGKQLYIEGKIRTTKYQDREGVDRWSTEVIADRVAFLGAREEGR